MSEIVSQPLMLKKKSKSSRFVNWTGEGNFFLDKILRAVYLTLLFVINFVMFLYSVNGRVLENGVINEAGLYIVGGVGAFFLVLILFFSFSKMAQNIICAVFTMIFVAMFFYQFAEFNPDVFIEKWLEKKAKWLTFIGIVPSCWLVGLVLGAIIYFAFKYSMVILFVVLVLTIGTFLGIRKNEVLKSVDNEYKVVKEMPANVGGKRDTNIVYFRVPKFPSYQFLSSIRDANFRELRNMMIGFFATNEFEIYPNAFVENMDTMGNIVDIYNQVDYTSTTSKNRGYSEFINDWNFIHGGLNFAGLDDNNLYSYLTDKGYGVSTYSMPGFNICMTGGKLNTDRCVIKGYKTVPWYDKEASLEKNIYTLLSELTLNLKRKGLKGTAKALANSSSIKGYRVNSENRRVSIEGAPRLFDLVAEQVNKDKIGQVYMVYVDLPSDIYIYDEFCNVKPRKDWVALKDNSLYSGGIDEKRKAYSDQAKCLIGKMQEFIDEIKVNGKLDRTDVIVQGVSSIRELGGMVAGKYGNFVKDNLVSLGIRKSKKTKFLINANVCLASDFTKTLIRFQDYCYTIDNMKMGQTDTFNLKKNLINNSVIRGGKITSIAVNYRDWYQDFKNNSVDYQKKIVRKRAKIDEQLKKEQEQAQKLEEKVEEEKVNPASSMLEDNIYVPSDDLIMELEEVEAKALNGEYESALNEEKISDKKDGKTEAVKEQTHGAGGLLSVLSKKAQGAVEIISDKAKEAQKKVIEKANELTSGNDVKAEQTLQKQNDAKEIAKEVKEATAEVEATVKAEAKEVKATVKEVEATVEAVKAEAKEEAEAVQDKVEATTNEVKATVKEVEATVEAVKVEAKEEAEAVQDKVETTTNEVKATVKEVEATVEAVKVEAKEEAQAVKDMLGATTNEVKATVKEAEAVVEVVKVEAKEEALAVKEEATATAKEATATVKATLEGEFKDNVIELKDNLKAKTNEVKTKEFQKTEDVELDIWDI